MVVRAGTGGKIRGGPNKIPVQEKEGGLGGGSGAVTRSKKQSQIKNNP